MPIATQTVALNPKSIGGMLRGRLARVSQEVRIPHNFKACSPVSVNTSPIRHVTANGRFGTGMGLPVNIKHDFAHLLAGFKAFFGGTGFAQWEAAIDDW
jgi:hypothetical protein